MRSYIFLVVDSCLDLESKGSKRKTAVLGSGYWLLSTVSWSCYLELSKFFLLLRIKYTRVQLRLNARFCHNGALNVCLKTGLTAKTWKSAPSVLDGCCGNGCNYQHWPRGGSREQSNKLFWSTFWTHTSSQTASWHLHCLKRVFQFKCNYSQYKINQTS